MPHRRTSPSFAVLTLALAVVAAAGCSAAPPAQAPAPQARQDERALDPKDPQFAERLVERYRQLEAR